MHPSNRLSRLIAPLILLAACGDSGAATSISPSVAAQRTEQPSLQLASCPSPSSRSASAVIGAHGGVISAGSTVVFIPPHAVRSPTRFTVQPLAGRTLQVRIVARGHHRFEFARPIAVMIGYAHCARQEFPRTASVWHIDDRTGAPLERMPTVNDSRNDTVGFLTVHLSTYAVAN